MVRRLLAAHTVGAVAAVAGVVALGCALSCAAPTLPLPPPLAPTVSQGPDADHVTLSATCNPPERYVEIIVLNVGGSAVAVPHSEAVGGALTDGCGQWQTIVFAHSGDALDVTYNLGGEISLPTRVYAR